MFTSSRGRSQYDSFSKHRAGKASSSKAKRSFREASLSRRVDRMDISPQMKQQSSPGGSPHLTSAIITLCVGHEQRLFAAHEDVLTHSPFFASLARGQFFEPSGKRIDLPDEEPLVLSSVLEYLYKGDYFPRLEYDKRSRTFHLEDASMAGSPGGPNQPNADIAVYVSSIGASILKDTLIYCAADKYGLPELKKLALRKQGLQSGVQCNTILTSARYAYANTPDSDSRLRAHYLALIIRSRHTFKRSGTMQNEMEAGGKLFFDLFVAMSNHMDDIAGARSPR